jgi:hypothetical protein
MTDSGDCESAASPVAAVATAVRAGSTPPGCGGGGGVAIAGSALADRGEAVFAAGGWEATSARGPRAAEFGHGTIGPGVSGWGAASAFGDARVCPCKPTSGSIAVSSPAHAGTARDMASKAITNPRPNGKIRHNGETTRRVLIGVTQEKPGSMFTRETPQQAISSTGALIYGATENA